MRTLTRGALRFFFRISLAPFSGHKISRKARRVLENEIPLRDASTYDFIQIDATAASQVLNREEQQHREIFTGQDHKNVIKQEGNSCLIRLRIRMQK